MTRDVLALMKAAGLGHIPVIVGGIIPPEDAETLRRKASPPSTRPKISPSTGSWPTLLRPWSGAWRANDVRAREKAAAARLSVRLPLSGRNRPDAALRAHFCSTSSGCYVRAR